MIRAKFPGCALLLALLLSSCLRHEVKLPDRDDYQEVNQARSENLKQEIASRSLLPKAFRASYQFEAQNRIEKQVFRQAVVFESPDNLRIDVFASSFQKLVSLIIATNGNFSALDAVKNVLYQGQSTRKNIGLLTHLPLNVDEYAAWALGMPFLEKESNDPTELTLLQRSRRSEEFLAQEKSEDGRKVNSFFVIPPGDGKVRLQYLEFFSPNAEGKDEHLKIQYRYRSPTGNDQSQDADVPNCPADVPSEIRFSSPTLGIWGKLVCEKFEIDPDLSEIRERLFRIRVPDSTGVETRLLD